MKVTKYKNGKTKKISLNQFTTSNHTFVNKSSEDLSLLEDSSIDSVVTSPPYFNLRVYTGNQAEVGLEKTIEEYVQTMVNFSMEIYRVLKDTGSYFLNLGDTLKNGDKYLIPHRVAIALKEDGWILNDEIVWSKNNPIPSNNKRSIYSHEYIFHFVKTKEFKYNYQRKADWSSLVKSKTGRMFSVLETDSSIIKTNVANSLVLRKECRLRGFELANHALYPVELPLYLISLSTDEGDLVLDPFSGSGTTGEAALMINRNYVGYELDPLSIKASVIRLDMALANAA